MSTTIKEGTFQEWLPWFRSQWEQGEHIALIGPTGAGKTTVMCSALTARLYVVVIAIKREDPVLALFARNSYRIMERVEDIVQAYPFPKPYRVVLWIRPRSLFDTEEQAEKIQEALNHLYLAGQWCIFLDDMNYLTGQLEMKQELGVLLGQGRSSGLSIVCAMTQPKSLINRIPTEPFKQARHVLIWRYRDMNEVKACAEIAGVSFPEMRDMQQRLGQHDFLYAGKCDIVLVRNSYVAQLC